MKLDIHDYPKRLKREFEQLEKLSSRNKELILRFYDDCVLQGLSRPRVVKLVETVRVLAGFLEVLFSFCHQ